MVIQGSNLPAQVIAPIAPYFGRRASNPEEVIDRGSLPSDPKPLRLVTPAPQVSLGFYSFINF